VMAVETEYTDGTKRVVVFVPGVTCPGVTSSELTDLSYLRDYVERG